MQYREIFLDLHLVFFGSILMGITGTANAMTIIGFFTLIIMAILFKEMKTKVGLKPEQYDKKDIEFKI